MNDIEAIEYLRAERIQRDPLDPRSCQQLAVLHKQTGSTAMISASSQLHNEGAREINPSTHGDACPNGGGYDTEN